MSPFSAIFPRGLILSNVDSEPPDIEQDLAAGHWPGREHFPEFQQEAFMPEQNVGWCEEPVCLERALQAIFSVGGQGQDLSPSTVSFAESSLIYIKIFPMRW